MIIKMYAIFCRETLRKMKFEGKLAAQAGHAYLHAWWDAEDRMKYERTYYGNHDNDYDEDLSLYYHSVMKPYRESNDARKIALVVDTVEELEELYAEFKPHMGATIVDDCGYTVFSCTTTTAVGLGPIPSDWTKGTRLADLETLRNEIHESGDLPVAAGQSAVHPSYEQATRHIARG
jgi:peptidyl-tRNA hydrolase